MAACRLSPNVIQRHIYRLQTHWQRSLGVLSGNSQKISTPGSIHSADDCSIHSTIIPHQCCILLHSSQPISEFPARWNTPIQRALQLQASRWGGLVNFSWYGLPPAATDPLGGGGVRAKNQPATAFTAAGGRLDIPDITLENIDQVEQKLKEHLNGPLSKETGDESIYMCVRMVLGIVVAELGEVY